MTTKNLEAAIIGGGINGVTTALYLQLCGVKATIYAETVTPSSGLVDPRFPSAYALASVIPHSVFTKQEGLEPRELARDSQAFFKVFADNNFAGIDKREHWEVFENKVPVPDYAPDVADFEKLPDDGSGLYGAPRRTDAAAIFGWKFNCFFANMTFYRQTLLDLFKVGGGEVVEGKKFDRETILNLKGDFIVNCAGLGGNIFDDEFAPKIIRGHLLTITPPPNAQLPFFNTSYNYTPANDIYPGNEGPCDVYCYPRSGSWGLGGSRQVGIEKNGVWVGQQTLGETLDICNPDHSTVTIPRAVFELNRELISGLTGVDINSWDKHARIGYRPSSETGLSISGRMVRGRFAIQNLGHGGAGVTISPACAVRIGQMAGKHFDTNLEICKNFPPALVPDQRLALELASKGFNAARYSHTCDA